MSCPDCADHATPEQILELIERHHSRLEAEFTRRMTDAVDEVNRQVNALLSGQEQRPASATLH